MNNAVACFHLISRINTFWATPLHVSSSYLKKQYNFSNTKCIFLHLISSNKVFRIIKLEFWINAIAYFLVISRINTFWATSMHVSSSYFKKRYNLSNIISYFLIVISSNKVFRIIYLLIWIMQLLVSILFQESIHFEQHHCMFPFLI